MTPNMVKFLVTVLLVQLGFICFVFVQGYQGREDLVTSQRTACNDRGRVANKANADFQNAHTKYITKVTKATSVKSDVKDAANEAVKTFRRTSAILTNLANINCTKAIPGAKLIP